MTKPIILCDVDGVVLDWLSKLPEYLVKRGLNPEGAIRALSHGEFVSHSEITGLPEAEAFKLVLDYNESEYIRYLTPYKDALGVVNLLKSEFDFIAVTAIGREGKSTEYRMQNLDFWYPNAFKKIHVVDIYESKESILKQYPPSLFIDDTPKHVAQAKSCGHISIRIVRDARPDIVNSLRFNDWKDIGTFIEQQRLDLKTQ